MRVMTSIFTMSISLALAPASSSSQPRERPYDLGEPVMDQVPICTLHRCVGAKTADGSLAASPGGWVSSQPSVNMDADWTSTYTPPTGLLGTDTDLEPHFQNFLTANQNFIARLYSGTVTGGFDVSSGGGSLSQVDPEALMGKASEYGAEVWRPIINSENAYFDAIADLAGTVNDKEAQNAIVHATISAHLALDVSPAFAERVGDAKEIIFRGKLEDTAKDVLNNAAGRDIAMDIKTRRGSAEDIPAAIAEAYRNGDLWIVRHGEVVPSNTSK